MSTSIRKILFTHLKRLLQIRFQLRRLIQSCKSHPIWERQPPELVVYIEDQERQLRAIERGIYEFQLELETNSMTRNVSSFSFVHIVFLFC